MRNASSLIEGPINHSTELRARRTDVFFFCILAYIDILTNGIRGMLTVLDNPQYVSVTAIRWIMDDLQSSACSGEVSVERYLFSANLPFQTIEASKVAMYIMTALGSYWEQNQSNLSWRRIEIQKGTDWRENPLTVGKQTAFRRVKHGFPVCRASIFICSKSRLCLKILVIVQGKAINMLYVQPIILESASIEHAGSTHAFLPLAASSACPIYQKIQAYRISMVTAMPVHHLISALSYHPHCCGQNPAFKNSPTIAA